MQKVECGYQGKNRGFGTYDTLEQAVFINEFIRGTLQATKNADLTDEEIRKNIKLAKEGANHALSELPEGGAMPETSSEAGIPTALSALTGISPYTESFSEDALRVDYNRPKLLSGTSQPKEVRVIQCLLVYQSAHCLPSSYFLVQSPTQGFDVWLTNRKRKWRLKQLTNELDRPKLLPGCLQPKEVSNTHKFV